MEFKHLVYRESTWGRKPMFCWDWGLEVAFSLEAEDVIFVVATFAGWQKLLQFRSQNLLTLLCLERTWGRKPIFCQRELEVVSHLQLKTSYLPCCGSGNFYCMAEVTTILFSKFASSPTQGLVAWGEMSYILLCFRQSFSVFRQCCLMTNILYTSLFLGNGGLFRVPANEIYRDPKTRAAIIRVSRLSSLSSTCHKSKIPISIICWQLFTPTRKCRFASAFQPLQDMRAERNRQNKYFS